MKINIFNEECDYKYKNKKKISDIIAIIKEKEQKKFEEINIIFCSDEYLKKINNTFLGRDYYTDVITFQYGEKIISGDIFISIERVIDNAKYYKKSKINELKRVIIHSIIHLCGFNDKSIEEKKIMREKENYYLKYF